MHVHATCPVCDFPIGSHDAADGPAYVGIFVVGTFATLLAVALELWFEAPMWLQIAIIIPFTLIGSLVNIILLKSVFIALQYRHNLGGWNDSDIPSKPVAAQSRRVREKE
ncbi:MAG: DUF983 domain-containing protein [Proteobacteria bacterium]|nr:DUF983 domain-containing protein [Pseudomonadota bacterium]